MAPSSNDKPHSSGNNNSTATSASFKSDYQIIKDGRFGNMKNFMESYGLKCKSCSSLPICPPATVLWLETDVRVVGDDGDHQEAKAIIDGFRKIDEANKK